ncbi:MAG TPA: penicillin-binding protein 1C [Cyclobacteriaceae bacterium]|nr:penicillin-binding protein 1C [Cyclobacteriaceae bacterium]HPW62405.1 penicillin-binding protein 1C [Cyclobacteriaceae bacterium]
MRAILKKYRYYLFFTFALLVLYYFSLPGFLFNEPYSTVLEDREGKLLGAAIADDGQWRFPEGSPVPQKFKEALILFEDKRFYNHPGVDILSMSRAIRQNLKAGEIVSGGSTLSMQVIRLARRNKSRTFFEKSIEAVLATRLELRSSKEEILSLYAAHAPFGGNVVGIEAACWRYFGRDASELSWSEAALLAVLPNNPSLIHPGKNREVLKAKRDRLLIRLMQSGKMDSTTYELSIAESIPENPVPLPRSAYHLLTRAIKEGYGQTRVKSTLNLPLQERVNQIVADHQQVLRGNQVFNAAALVLEVNTGKVLAYTGNAPAGREHGEQVDIIQARRSTGSILKPFLFAAMLDEGKLLTGTLQPDIPTLINGFSPKNFTREHDGAVAADQALIRSLNIPAVHELREYRYEKFYELLKHVGLTTLNQPADHYGLSLILGGAEGTLWDITGAYASMARTLQNYFEVPGKIRYDKSDFHSARYLQSDSVLRNNPEENSWLSAASIYLTFDVLKEVYRPGEETGWRLFNSTKKIAWKTGTSHGLRDGWAVGVNGDYAVGVWVGNADGEGRPGLTGTESASPIMFDIFSQLPGNSWFQVPLMELNEVQVCSRSGMRATALCSETKTVKIPQAGLQSVSCRYHQNVHLSLDGKFRVHADCESISRIKSVSWFVLPPVQEYYFKSKNLSYKILPPLRGDCVNPTSVASMDLIYPKANAAIFIPHELDGRLGSALFEVAHRQPSVIVYWHIDGNYLGVTRGSHRLAVSPDPGQHILTLVDDQGNILEQQFSVIARN